MYYVYVIELPKREIYVGCTNNTVRRKNQHNENIRNGKNRFAQYVSKNYPSLILKKKDLKVIAAFENRSEALKYEKKTAKSFIGKRLLLNDVYNIDCSRLGKNIGKSSKKYVLIDYVEHTYKYLEDLRQYCIKNDLDYKLIQRTVRDYRVAYDKYKVFYQCDWDDLENKEYYLSGQFRIDILNRYRELKKEKYSKTYLLETPDNKIIEVKNLDEFARQHNISSGTLHATYITKHRAKGYKVIKRV